MKTKQELLKKIHRLVWKNDDLMNQKTLFELQALVDAEIIEEAKAGKMKIKQLPNGFISKIECCKQKKTH